MDIYAFEEAVAKATSNTSSGLRPSNSRKEHVRVILEAPPAGSVSYDVGVGGGGGES